MVRAQQRSYTDTVTIQLWSHCIVWLTLKSLKCLILAWCQKGILLWGETFMNFHKLLLGAWKKKIQWSYVTNTMALAPSPKRGGAEIWQFEHLAPIRSSVKEFLKSINKWLKYGHFKNFKIMQPHPSWHPLTPPPPWDHWWKNYLNPSIHGWNMAI